MYINRCQRRLGVRSGNFTRIDSHVHWETKRWWILCSNNFATRFFVSKCAVEKNANQFSLCIRLPRALWFQSEQRPTIRCKFDWIRHIVLAKWQHLAGDELRMIFIRLIYLILFGASVSVVTCNIDKWNDVESRSHLFAQVYRRSKWRYFKCDLRLWSAQILFISFVRSHFIQVSDNL